MVKDKIVKAIERAIHSLSSEKTGKMDIRLETPELESHGDYSTNVAMVIAKRGKKDPRKLAKEIVEKLSNYEELAKRVSRIEVAGSGFINFWLSETELTKYVLNVLKEKDGYGSSTLLRGERILLEHTSPNTIKTLHLGHVRNNILGAAVHNLLEYCGANVTLDAVNNDRGIHVMKAVWAYVKYGGDKTPKDENKKPDQFVDQFYVQGAKAFEEDGEVKEEIRELLRKWEAGDQKVVEVWKKLRDWTIEGFQKTYGRLGSKHDYQWFESDYYRGGKNIAEAGIKDGVFRKLEDGALLSNLGKYNLSDTVIVRADGTSMYPTQDLCLTQLKRERFPSDLYIWDVGPEQTLYMKQLFAMCEQLGIGKRDDYFHMTYGFVYLRGRGKMSSRKGTVISADWLMDKVVEKAGKIIGKSETGGDLTDVEKDKISEAVGLGAIKYAFLRPARLTDIQFDIGESVNLDGNSGPYLQYTYARTQSVLKKSKIKNRKLNSERKYKLNQEELSLMRSFIHFSEVIVDAAKNYSPNLLCNYLFDLAQKFNNFYEKHRILSADNRLQSTAKFRVALTEATGQILKNGLTLLGIKIPERM